MQTYDFPHLLTPALFHELERTSYPEGWSVDWSSEPLRYAFRGSGRAYPLNWEVPLQLGRIGDSHNKRHSTSFAERLGQLLASLAMPQETRLVAEPIVASNKVGPLTNVNKATERFVKFISPNEFNLFRPIPSGGGLFPWEIYILWRGPTMSAGIYHYDLCHHQLQEISALSNTIEKPEAIVYITAVHWKNYFKYGNACTHLHGLDSGILSSTIEIVAPSFGIIANFHPWPNVEEIAELLKIDLDAESVIAQIELQDYVTKLPVLHPEIRSMATDVTTGYTPTRGIECAAARLLNQISRKPHAKRNIGMANPWKAGANESTPRTIALPPAAMPELRDIVDVLRNRRSGIDPWNIQPLSLDIVSCLMTFAVNENRTENNGNTIGDAIALFGAFQHVPEITSGYYRFDAAAKTLVRHHECILNEMNIALQAAYFLGNINLGAATIVFSVVADLDYAFGEHGEHAFCAMDVAAGRIIQRIVMLAASLGLGTHVIYGFDSATVLEQFKINQGRHGLLLSVVVGAPPVNVVSVPLPFWL